MSPKSVLSVGEALRDNHIWTYPILPGAILVFQQLSSSREWTISGKPTAVSRAVEFLNSTKTIDPSTGWVDVGFEAYLKRKALDYIVLGRTACAVRKPRGLGQPYLEYIDPTRLSFGRQEQFGDKVSSGVNATYNNPVKPGEKVWEYEGKWIKDEDVHIHHPVPIGGKRFTAPILHLIPTATLAWLIREHDAASLDGRKIRDIIFVGNLAMFDAIKDAINTTAALWAGASPEELGGIPVVEVNNPNGQPMENFFARLGISNIPESFDREEFIFRYVNEISSALGLALRHFWNNEKTTNRALEVVQEQRQQQKGPAIFVRSEQRLINNSGMLKQFGNSVRFGFQEEADTSGMKDRAEVMRLHAEAIEKIATLIGAKVKPESLVSFMQSLDMLPNEIEMFDFTQPLVAVSPGQEINAEGEITDTSDPEPGTNPDQRNDSPADNFDKSSNKYLDYDEVTMNGEGIILSRRRKVWHFHEVLQHEVAKKMKELYPVNEETLELDGEIKGSLMSNEGYVDSSALDQLLRIDSVENRLTLKRLYAEIPDELDRWAVSQKKFSTEAVNEVIDKTLKNVNLADNEQHIVDFLVEEMGEQDEL